MHGNLYVGLWGRRYLDVTTATFNVDQANIFLQVHLQEVPRRSLTLFW